MSDKPQDSEIVIYAAQRMFESVHGYHVDLNWDNAHQTHKDLYLKLARIADPIFRVHYDEQYWVDQVGNYGG